MLILSENNLGKRHKELNTKVQEAVKNNVKLEDLPEVEESDVDKIFKIDIASIYKNIDYIISVLKSGDSLYISRVLKCTWIYENDYSHIINPDYLETNVFPDMSAKMKNKMLSAIATHVRDEERAHSFYVYCKNLKMENYAHKFLIFTREEIKAQEIKEGVLVCKELDYVKNYIGNSFSLALVYIDYMINTRKSCDAVNDIHHMYSVSNNFYLDLVEKYFHFGNGQSISLGFRISKDIFKKHKNRIMKSPLIYLNILHPKTITQCSKIDDAKFYLNALMPDTATEFWDSSFNTNYKHIIDVIPADEAISVLKSIFTQHYENTEFEMDKKFYEQEFYELMTIDQKEEWALRHLANDNELLGFGNDYKWYKFVRFEKAFPGIKKIILITADKDKRKAVVKTLIHTPRGMRDIEHLLNYYYERHVNESTHSKADFIDMLLENHNVYNFDDECWQALDRILCSMEIYILSGSNSSKDSYKYVAMIYNIVHDKKVPDGLKQQLDNYFDVSTLKRMCDGLDTEKLDMVYKYMFEHFKHKIELILKGTRNHETRIGVQKYIYSFLNLINAFSRSKDNIPEFIYNYIKQYWEDYEHHQLFVVNEDITQEDLIRGLKNDAKSIVKDLPRILKEIKRSWLFDLRKLLKKLRTYFYNDVAQDYLNYFKDILVQENEKHSLTSIQAYVFVIFQLANEEFKNKFMVKYAPTSPKIDHANIETNLLHIQQSICRLACYSRVPVPLDKILMYVKGDYVHFCLPMFNRYLAQLPLPLCLSFAKSLLDTPLSVQKHAVRLAFKCFTIENIVSLIEDIWKKSKNISLRYIIYKSLYEKVSESESDVLFGLLEKLTKTLHSEDDPQIFEIVTSNKLPNKYRADYLEVCWVTVSKIESSEFLNHQHKILPQMEEHIRFMKKSFILSIINEHIKHMLVDDKYVLSQYSNYYHYESGINVAKMELTARFIVAFDDEKNVDEAITLMKSILNPCFEMWDESCSNVYSFRKYFSEFLSFLLNKSYDNSLDYTKTERLFTTLLNEVEENVPMYNKYLIVWEINLSLITKKVIQKAKPLLDDSNESVSKISLDFGKELGGLIVRFAENAMYYESFLEEMLNFINTNIEKICDALPDINTSSEDRKKMIYVLVCLSLTELKTRPTYFIALKLMPRNESGVQYDEVIERIKKFDDIEIKCYMYHIFENEEFKKCYNL